MGIFKKVIAKHKDKVAARKEKHRHHKNAGDRHHSRKNARQEHRALVKSDRRAAHYARIALRKANKGTSFGSFTDKLGDVANNYIALKREGQQAEEAFTNGDGTVTATSSGVTYSPSASDKVYMGHETASDYEAAGGTPVEHNDFVDVDGDGLDDQTGETMDEFLASHAKGKGGAAARKSGGDFDKPFVDSNGDGLDDVSGLTKETHNSFYQKSKDLKAVKPAGNTGGYAWARKVDEGRFAWIWRLVTEKPLMVVPVLLVVLATVALGVVKLVKKLKNRKKRKY